MAMGGEAGIKAEFGFPSANARLKCKPIEKMKIFQFSFITEDLIINHHLCVFKKSQGFFFNQS